MVANLLHDGLVIGLMVAFSGTARHVWENADNGSRMIHAGVIQWTVAGIFAGLLSPIAYQITGNYLWAVAGSVVSIVLGTKVGHELYRRNQRQIAANARGQVMRERAENTNDNRLHGDG